MAQRQVLMITSATMVKTLVPEWCQKEFLFFACYLDREPDF